MSKHVFTYADCKEKKVHVSPNDCGGVGYAVVSEDGAEKMVCYGCCGKRDCVEMEAKGRIVLYLTKKSDSWFVSNWPGTLQFPVREHRTGNHNIADTRETVWFTDSDGREWYGVCYGYNTQLCECSNVIP